MDEVVGHTWQFVDVGGEPVGDVPDRSRPTLTFELDGQVYGSGGVNRLRGTWSYADGRLTFGPVATTLMAGTPEHLARERAVLDLLTCALTVEVRDGALLLTDADGRRSRLVVAPGTATAGVV